MPDNDKPYSELRPVKRHILVYSLVYGLCGGLLILLLKLVEYRFLVVEHSAEIYRLSRPGVCELRHLVGTQTYKKQGSSRRSDTSAPIRLLKLNNKLDSIAQKVASPESALADD